MKTLGSTGLGSAKKNALALLLVALFSGLFLGVSLWMTGLGDGVFIDETHTLATIQHPFSEIISLCREDTHPPLYYLYARAWASVFGASTGSMEVASIVPFFLALALVSAFLRREFSRTAAVLFPLIANANFFVFYYSLDIRDYTLAFLFVSAASIFGWYFVKQQIPRLGVCVGLGASMLLAAGTHYYAGAICAIGGALLFLHTLVHEREKLRRLLTVGFAVVLLYLPWLPAFLNIATSATRNFWLPPFSFKDLLWPLIGLFWSSEGVFSPLPAALCALAFALLAFLLAGFFLRRKEKQDYFAFALVSCPAILYALMVLHGLLSNHPLLLLRYLFPAYGLVWMFLAIELGRNKNKTVKVLAASLFAICAFTTTIPNAVRAEQEQNQKFDAFYGLLAREKKPDDIFSVVGDEPITSGVTRLTLAFLFPQTPNVYLRLGYSDGIGGDAHYRKVYDKASLVPFAEVRDLEAWKKWENCAAWVVVFRGEKSRERFLDALGGAAVEKFPAGAERPERAEIYRVFPAQKLHHFLQAEASRSKTKGTP